MQFEPTALPGVILIKPSVFEDARGHFFESWHEERFRSAGITAHFVQDNHSHSVQRTLRGLHYQVRHPQGKLLRVVQGEVFDVAVDIRRASPWFGRWIGVNLNESNRHILWIPPGFAHGYFTKSHQADVLYKCTDFYSPEDERAIHWNDTQIGVTWPLPDGNMPIVSTKDAAAPRLAEAECYP